MINISNKTSRLTSILKMLDKLALEQIKKDQEGHNESKK